MAEEMRVENLSYIKRQLIIAESDTVKCSLQIFGLEEHEHDNKSLKASNHG